MTSNQSLLKELRSSWRLIEVDHDAFHRRYHLCDLRACRGMCCYDGVYLHEEEERAIDSIYRQSHEFLRLSLPVFPETPVVDGPSRGKPAGRKTALRPAVYAGKENYPDHFSKTTCCFIAENGFCSLQSLAVAQGKHPWSYKPLGCWLHPMTVRDGVLTIPTSEGDPNKRAGYPGFVSSTECGLVRSCGSPGYEVFAEELRTLGQILGRDLLREIRKL